MSQRLIVFSLIVVGLVLSLVAAGQLGLFAGPRPSGLGAADGRLKPVPSTPNAVSSQATDEHAIAPLAYAGDGGTAFTRAVDAVRRMHGAAIVVERPGYIHAECTTRWLRFVDDLELLLDERNRVIHVRSASRIGHSDVGTNRARVEALRAAFAASD